jgi:hypothetical protein
MNEMKKRRARVGQYLIRVDEMTVNPSYFEDAVTGHRFDLNGQVIEVVKITIDQYRNITYLFCKNV